MSNPVISVKNLIKNFDNHVAIDNASFEIQAGKIVGLVGPDGAGKTTLMRLLAGLLLPSSGNIIICGYDTKNQESLVQEQIGYMPQKFGLYEDLTVMENLNLYMSLKNISQMQRNEMINDVLEFTQLSSFTSLLAGYLSGGMKQKLGLGCALLSKPNVLLLDEPSVGVDPISRIELWKMVNNLITKNITVVWSTSYLDEAEKCDIVVALSEGRIIFLGSPNRLTEKVNGQVYTISPEKKEKRNLLTLLIQQKNVIDCTISGSQLRLVMKKNVVPSSLNINLPNILPTPPRFEDAFIAELGGIRERTSKLAEYFDWHKNSFCSTLAAKNLTKKFGEFTAVNHINLDIFSGEIFGLLGPNGAGKSTTFKMLCGLLKPSIGSASVIGYDLGKTPSQARVQIGYMAQKFSLYNELSALQNLQFFAGIYGLNGKKQKYAIQLMTDTFELGDILSETTGNLPLGFKQRLALSCAVMHKPPLIFLDEPTSGVDPIIRREFWLHINNIVEKGTTVMVTTHFMEEAEYCDRIALVYNGNIIAAGTPDELKSQVPTHVAHNPKMEDAFIYLIEKSRASIKGDCH